MNLCVSIKYSLSKGLLFNTNYSGTLVQARKMKARRQDLRHPENLITVRNPSFSSMKIKCGHSSCELREFGPDSRGQMQRKSVSRWLFVFMWFIHSQNSSFLGGLENTGNRFSSSRQLTTSDVYRGV